MNSPKNILKLLDYRTVLRELMVHRVLVTAAVLGMVVWFLLTGTHKGQVVWVANRPLSPGEIVTIEDFDQSWLETSNYEQLVSEIDFSDPPNLVAAVPAGSPLLRTQVGDVGLANRIIINLPLEAGDAGDYPTGSLANVWGVRDGMVDLISSDAIILGTVQSNLGAARLSLSLPAAAEFDAVTVSAIRVVLKPN